MCVSVCLSVCMFMHGFLIGARIYLCLFDTDSARMGETI